ncbi:MAG: transglycosylase SLT domain-containing protein [Spirochaetales bacterium]|nr:transglycosylase SLT domain-containing protein [Spirochaetales bacterium]
MKKYLSLFLLYFIFFSCQASEHGSDRVWDLDVSALVESLRIGDLAFLDNVDLYRMDRKNRLGEISRIREGGALYFSHLLGEKGEREWQIRFLEEELTSGLYKEEAVRELYSLLSPSGEWNRLSRILLNAFDEGRLTEELVDVLIEALYESGQSEKALQYAGEQLLTLPAAKAYVKGRGDLSSDIFLHYIYGRASFSEAAALFSLLEAEDRLSELSGSSAAYLELARAIVSGNDSLVDQKLDLFSISPGMAEMYPSLIYRLRIPQMQSSRTGIWAAKLSVIPTFEAVFTAGRLYRSEKKFEDADLMFRNARDLAGSPFERDRSWWYLMDLYSSNSTYLNGLIEEAAPLWSDPFYFSDILEEHLSSLAAEARWDLLERIYPFITQYGDRETASAYSWVRFLSPPFRRAGEAERRFVLSILKEAPAFSFYSILGHVLSGDVILFAGAAVPAEETYDDRYIQGFFQFGLDEKALENSRGREEGLSKPLLRILSEKERDRGDFLRSIQLASYLMPDDDSPVPIEDLKLRYPLVFHEQIEQYSEEYGFPPEILQGIIRTESAFTHDIISHAGAVGLSQLMPETAADQARKLGMGEPDLTDPETNIRIGSSYIRWILDRPWSDNLSQMLVAYNGGGGNLRKWKRMFPGYSDELFIEALPYKETRNYVKKVLTSSVVYGAVYGEDDPADIIGKIYPDFDSLLEIHGN